MAQDGRQQPGLTAIVLFFAFGCFMSGLAFMMLLFPGSFLEPLWALNPKARAGLATLGWWSLLLMLAVCLSCAAASFGLWNRQRWGYRLSLGILVVNTTADTVNALVLGDRRTLIGLPIAAIMVAYLLAKRRVFARESSAHAIGYE